MLIKSVLVLSAVGMKNYIFWDIMSCRLYGVAAQIKEFLTKPVQQFRRCY
jgi:hypothetical protein